MSFIFLIIAIGATYAILIVPQQRKLKRHAALVSAVVVGDEILTASGIYGTIVAFEGDQDEIMRLEVAEGVIISMARSAVTEVAVEEVAVEEVAVEEVADEDVDGGAEG